MPGADAWAAGVSSTAAAASERNPETAPSFLVFKWLMVAFLIKHDDFGHQPAEVLGVVRQMVELRGVEHVRARRHAGGIDDGIERLATAERDRVGLDVEIVPGFVAQQLGLIR